MCWLQYDCVTSLLVTRRWPQFSFKTVAEERRGVNWETFCREMLKRYNNDINLCWSSKWQIWMMYRAQCCLIIPHCINQAAWCFFFCLCSVCLRHAENTTGVYMWIYILYLLWMLVFWNLKCAWLFCFYSLFSIKHSSSFSVFLSDFPVAPKRPLWTSNVYEQPSGKPIKPMLPPSHQDLQLQLLFFWLPWPTVFQQVSQVLRVTGERPNILSWPAMVLITPIAVMCKPVWA